LGPTQGFERDWQDFYTDTQHPKQLWVKALSADALAQARLAQLGVAPMGGSPQQFATLISDTRAQIQQLVKQRKMVLD